MGILLVADYLDRVKKFADKYGLDIVRFCMECDGYRYFHLDFSNRPRYAGHPHIVKVNDAGELIVVTDINEIYWVMKNKIKIVEIVFNDDLTVDVLFNDGIRRRIDVGDFVRKHPHPQYNKYLEIANFKKGKLVDGNVIWGNDLEFHVEDLYGGVG